MYLVGAIFLLVVNTATENVVYDTIIIGAGLAGIGASKVLSQHGVKHLMIEARDRIGGRVWGVPFEGETIQLGGLVLHSPHKRHPILQAMRELNWSSIPLGFHEEGFYYESEGPIDKDYNTIIHELSEVMIEWIVEEAKKEDQDLSVKQMGTRFFESKTIKVQKRIEDALNWVLQNYGNVQGSDLSFLSAKNFQNDQTPDDLLPVGGYSSLVQAIFKTCRPYIRLQEKVTSIDYGGDVVKVLTSKGSYYSKTVVSSLPLGVIKSNTVNFIPPLPSSYLSVYDNIFEGTHEKMVVSFDKPFWEAQHQWLNFVGKDKSYTPYPIAWVIPSKHSHLVMFFISGIQAEEFLKRSNQQAKDHLIEFLSRFTTNQIVIKDIIRTDWLHDEFTKGAYISFKVGANRATLSKVQQPLSNKLWIVGEHTDSLMRSLTQGAFESGKKAALSIVQLLRKGVTQVEGAQGEQFEL